MLSMDWRADGQQPWRQPQTEM